MNKLNTSQTIFINIDKTTNKVIEFNYQISNTQKISLKRSENNDTFVEKLVSIKLNKIIIYQENLILQSLYKSATEKIFLLIL